jgi:hypothetical protein
LGVDQQLGLAETLASVIPDHRNPLCITHSLADILRARIFAIACGYPDADDLDHLRRDPAFKLACGRLPESGDDLASQPTISRWENAPDLCTLLRLGYAMVDLWCRSYRRPPKSVTLDIDDTVDVVHGQQQLSLFNAHYDERCFLPIHVYDADSGHCVAVLLRPGKTPTGEEIRGHLRRLVRRIRRHWPNTARMRRCSAVSPTRFIRVGHDRWGGCPRWTIARNLPRLHNQRPQRGQPATGWHVRVVVAMAWRAMSCSAVNRSG